ncbi:hypothetical protein Lalb_Chr02g0142551 [Lupinus albus]|uniref:Uncharacterized protein n=1 Tax=Lupinus albus TaxID=3870 RepID=A0A6A4QVL8_LUPAL|nr:hypothetical protein Lalb_Chr02g0142551 [Lupinus albus]
MAATADAKAATEIAACSPEQGVTQPAPLMAIPPLNNELMELFALRNCNE